MMGHDYAHCADYDEVTCPQICFRGQLVRDYRDRVHTDMQGVPVSWMHLRGTTECVGVHNIATHVPIRVHTNGEYISREDVVRAVAATNPHFSDRLLIIEKIREIPAADVRPVVRCRDCVHRDPEDKKCDCGALERAGCFFPVEDDYFCKHGARRRKETDDGGE